MNIHPSARGGKAAKAYAKQERHEMRLYDTGALTDYTDASERARSEAEVCPYCDKEVHPSNWNAHMVMYHAENALTDSECHELEKHEAVIESGLQTFYSVGTALLAIRDNRLYRQQFKTFEKYCQDRWNFKRDYAYKIMDAAEVVVNLSTNGIQNLPANERQTRPLTQLEPEEQQLVWQVVEETAPAGKITQQHVKSVVSVLKEITTTRAIDSGDGEQIPTTQATVEHLKAAVTEETYERIKRQEAYIAEKQGQKQQKATTLEALHSSKSNEWYTPAEYVKAVFAVLGFIDLDPASCEEANRTVKAREIFTIRDNGLAKQWFGNVYVNPPYGRHEDGGSNQAIWVQKLLQEYRAGNIEQAILLVSANTDCKWFDPLWDFPMVFTRRIDFDAPEGQQRTGPNHGSVLVYFGSETAAFVREMRKFGRIVVPAGTFSEVIP